MKWLLVALLLLLLFPLLTSRKHFGPQRPTKVTINQHHEVRPEFWHSEHPYAEIYNIFWCRPSGKIEFNLPAVYKDIRSALLEQTKWINALIRDAVKPSEEKVVVEMVVLADVEKYRDWDPVWIRKTSQPDVSTIRIFLNEAYDSEISEYCRQERFPSITFHTNISIGQYFAKPVLICRLGTPLCEIGKAIILVPILATLFMYCCARSCATFYRKMENDVVNNTTDRSGGYTDERDEYLERFLKKEDPQTRRKSWPVDQQDLPDEFQIIPEPSGPFDDPVTVDPQTMAEYERVRKKHTRKWTTGTYVC